MSPLIKKNPYYFYKLLTFKWHVSKFEPNQIISLQITVIQVKLLLHIFKTMENSEFRVLIEHCFLMGKNTVQAKQWLDKCVSDFAPSETTVKRWYADFKRGHTDTNDAKRSGCSNSAVVQENTKKLHELVLADCKWKLCEIAEELKISEGSVFTILHEHLSIRKLCPKWVSCLLTVDQNKNASTIQSVVCNCFNATKRCFCVNMWQWNDIDYFEKGRNINSEYYIAISAFERRNHQKTASNEKEKSAFSPRKCIVSQVHRNDGETNWITLRIASLFTRSGPKRMF